MLSDNSISYRLLEVLASIVVEIPARFRKIKRLGVDGMGRPRKIKSVKQLEGLWEGYKQDCDNQKVLTHNFSSKNSEFVSEELKRSVTYTIEGFCVYIGLSRSTFYQIYGSDATFSDTVTRIKEECEVDARKKFELSLIPSQLAGLWMSNYGYTTKVENEHSGGVQVNPYADLTTEELKKLIEE